MQGNGAKWTSLSPKSEHKRHGPFELSTSAITYPRHLFHGVPVEAYNPVPLMSFTALAPRAGLAHNAVDEAQKIAQPSPTPAILFARRAALSPRPLHFQVTVPPPRAAPQGTARDICLVSHCRRMGRGGWLPRGHTMAACTGAHLSTPRRQPTHRAPPPTLCELCRESRRPPICGLHKKRPTCQGEYPCTASAAAATDAHLRCAATRAPSDASRHRRALRHVACALQVGQVAWRAARSCSGVVHTARTSPTGLDQTHWRFQA
mmetsp:Transcript_18807/g.43225  ORF Transcript_18807/g.43225 Transcript_18807/m.43225 type:complete len:262 (-) Transcript_18807:132-917(-)